jgi:hypothetical protein
MEFTIEYWYRYKASDEQDCEIAKVIADTYEDAKKRIRNTWANRVFTYTDKTKYSEEIRSSGLINLLKTKEKQ